jgi:hypothetical protein
MSQRDYFTQVESGMAWHSWGRRLNRDPWWYAVDYKAAVLFWCSDLSCVEVPLKASSNFTYFEVVDPKGKRVSLGTTEKGAWVLALALIHDHLIKVRKERQCSE